MLLVVLNLGVCPGQWDSEDGLHTYDVQTCTNIYYEKVNNIYSVLQD